jgi:PIN domain nuclease of toxin-antitoxin system
LKLLEVKSAHVYSLGSLPQHHKDQFDRMIIAQAIAEALILVVR